MNHKKSHFKIIKLFAFLTLILFSKLILAQEKMYFNQLKVCEMRASDLSDLSAYIGDVYMKLEQGSANVSRYDIVRQREEQEDALYNEIIAARKKFSGPDSFELVRNIEFVSKISLRLAFDIPEEFPGKSKSYYQRRIESQCKVEVGNIYMKSIGR